VIEPIINLMGVSDAKIANTCLNAIDNILKIGRARQLEQGLAENPFAPLVEQADGLSKIEALQEDANQDVYQKAVKILESYFTLEDDGGAMAADDGAEFQFGAQAPQGGFQFGQGASVSQLPRAMTVP